jgi:high-affinity iron transporter
LQGRSPSIILLLLKSTFNVRYWPVLALLGAVAVALGFALVRPASDTPKTAGSDAQQLVAILQYLESDYPRAVASMDAGELAEQRSLSAEARSTALRLRGAERFAARIASLDERVSRSEDPVGVSADCASLVDEVIAAAGLSRAPSVPPDLSEGARLFQENCVTCHGATGHGDGVAAAGLVPKPSDFHSDAVMDSLTPYKVFNVIRFGVKGTAMAPVGHIDEVERWALSFYVLTLRQPPCDHSPSSVTLDDLANRSDAELARSNGVGEVACLRRKLPQLDASALVAAARTRVQQAKIMAGGGDARGAESAILEAYLSDIEPAEPWLRAHHPDVVGPLESSVIATRAALQQRDPRAGEEVVRLLALLDRATGAPVAKATAVSVFWFALLVIVREGSEAAVIIAALLAVVKKRKQFSRARFVHAGWLSAVAVGAIVFAAARNLLAGAMNERLEGCLALVAAAMLLHAALWLNARTTTRRTMGELRGRTHHALDRGALALFAIAFLAMFRESFETTVFLEALSVDAPSAVVWGAAAGAALLLGLVFAVSRLGLRLPMKPLFRVSTGMLLATAIVLLGEGIHSFEEVGILPSKPMRFIQIDFLGIYPDRIGLLSQLAVILALILWQGGFRDGSMSVSRLGGATHPGE